MTGWAASCARNGGGASTPATAAPGVTSPTPTGSLVTRWAADPWSLGSYSALPVGGRPEDRSTLAEPFGPIRVAGEATDADAPSTVHGALRSGRRAAAQVAASVPTGGRVVVIGAGTAGLAAAAALRDSHRVVVLEARDRRFGRVRTDRSTGSPVELGAAWIHGAEDNPLVELARAAGVATVPFDWDDSRVVDPNGVVDASDAEADLTRVLAELDERDDLADRSVAEAVAAVAADLGLDADDVARLDRLVVTEVEGEFALDATELGMSAWNEGAEVRGGDLLVVGGFDRILEPLGAGVDVRLRSPVDLISWSPDRPGARVLGPTVDETADVVVLTVPVAVLRSGRPRLDGPVPTGWRAALDRIATGVLDKVVLTFSEDAPDARWPAALVTQWWGDPRGRFAEWIDLAAATGAPTIITTSTGRSARDLEDLDDATVVSEALRALERVTG